MDIIKIATETLSKEQGKMEQFWMNIRAKNSGQIGKKIKGVIYSISWKKREVQELSQYLKGTQSRKDLKWE